LRPSFSYLPGEPLDEYMHLPPPDPGAPLDVHGNQVELLKQSRCYRSSNMTCLTCHNVHTTQHDVTEFSQRCLAATNLDLQPSPGQGIRLRKIALIATCPGKRPTR
jgi:hypothetical protein